METHGLRRGRAPRPRLSPLPVLPVARPGERVGIVAPYGRDAVLVATRLSAAGHEAEIFEGIPALCERLKAGGVGVAVLTSETIQDPGAAGALRIAVRAQPAWSDVPVVLLTDGETRAEEAARLLATVGVRHTATVLERPVSSASLIGTVRLAMLARRRQLEVRDLLAQLRDANATLEARVEARTREVRRLASDLTLAEQEERRRIAYLLHDDLQQRLYGVGIMLTVAHNAAGAPAPDVEAVAHHVAKARADIAGAAALTRTLSHEMAPPVLGGDSLNSLFDWLSDWARERHGLHVEADGAELAVPEEGVRVLLYQILRELLFNAAKHAGTDRVRVEAEAVEGGLRVVVHDDGDGFDPDGRGASGLGLTTVRERVELVGGRLELASRPGQGTRVAVVLPERDNPGAVGAP